MSRCAILLVVSAILVSGSYSQTAPRELFVPPNDVTLTIKTERSTYKIGEQIKITYTVRNVSNGALYVPGLAWSETCPPSPSIWGWFESSTGKHFVPGYLGDCHPKQMSTKVRIQKEAVLLKPDEAFEDYFILETRTFKKDMKPGRYRIEASFSGWREDEFSDAQKSELKELLQPLLRGESLAATSVALTVEIDTPSNSNR